MRDTIAAGHSVIIMVIVVGQELVQELANHDDLRPVSIQSIEGAHELLEARASENLTDLDHVLDLV